MNKTELVNAIAEQANLTKVQAKAALDGTIDSISKALAEGDKVALIGFGTFAVTEKGARTIKYKLVPSASFRRDMKSLSEAERQDLYLISSVLPTKAFRFKLAFFI